MQEKNDINSSQLYEFVDHTADMQMKVRGGSLEELFKSSGLAMLEIIYGKTAANIPLQYTEHLQVESTDLESLMVDWLSELLYLSLANRSTCL
ncbi:MAG: archease [Deltaproteobacteria bacterium]|nr:archease [Deltaproteobacteria bacterium]